MTSRSPPAARSNSGGRSSIRERPSQPYVPTSGSPVTTTVTTTTPLVIGSTLTVDVTGNTPVAVPDTASVTEDGTLVATGNVLANDTDGAGKTLSVATVNGIAVSGTTTIVGTYGTLVIQPNGQYTYTLANSQANVQALTSGRDGAGRFHLHRFRRADLHADGDTDHPEPDPAIRGLQRSDMGSVQLWAWIRW